jgi:hypothetical protein
MMMSYKDKRTFMTLGKRFCMYLIAIGTLGSSPAYCETNIEAIPTGWLLQDYLGQNMIAYYSGSNCLKGEIVMPASSTDAEKERFWSLVMTAKAANHIVGVFYDESNNCQITSLYER